MSTVKVLPLVHIYSQVSIAPRLHDMVSGHIIVTRILISAILYYFRTSKGREGSNNYNSYLFAFQHLIICCIVGYRFDISMNTRMYV